MNGIQDTKKINELKVAIPIIGSKIWMGGITYIYYLANALSLISKNVRPQIYLVFRDRQIQDLELHEYMFHLFDGLIYVGSEDLDLPYQYIQCHSYDELSEITDIYFPVLSNVLPNRVSVSWIPDFQHKHLPFLFSENEIEKRNSSFKLISEHKGVVVFSSQDALKDYNFFYPDNNTLNMVMPFYLVPPLEWYEEKDGLLSKYNIDTPYLICSNQLWQHKNHFTLFKAIKKLKDEGISINCVLTGATEDYRAPDYYKKLITYIDENHLQTNIKLLGFIPRQDQIYLLRKSIAVIQPSLFEGWGTVVEDSRALGKTIILSDIPIHREQQTEYSIFFEKENDESLASVIKNVFMNQAQHFSVNREKKELEKATNNAQRFATNFSNIIMQSYLHYTTRGGAV